ncbi:hypothetical protein VMCG_09559 [Cytospora schulzeri]|uniref:Uncharacterized protein n=1 Tax=Cytospora schulzeri TaxID=448051 RepID=A0A423VM22_9PEZI|nr:hypothetical protein VMCG_09559 [Valsa malicola]
MSIFVSDNDHNQVAGAKKAPFKLKVVDDAIKSTLQDAVEVVRMSAHSNDNDGADVSVDNGHINYTFFGKDGKIENVSTDHALAVEQPADKHTDTLEYGVTNDESGKNTLIGELNNAEANVAAASIDGAHHHTGMKTCARPDGTRYTIGGKGPLEHSRPAHKNAGMKTCTGPDGVRYTVGGKGPSMSAFSNIEDAEIADEDVEMSEEDAGFSDENSDEPDENDDVLEDDTEDDVIDSSPVPRDVGLKTCAKPDGTRYAIGGKGLVKPTESINEAVEPSEEDKIDSNSPTRSATGIKSCAMPDGTRCTIGNKGPSQAAPSHTEDVEVSEEDSDESDGDLDSEEGERQDLVKAVREEVEEKLEAIADLKQQLATQRNVILKKRLQGKLNKLEKEMQLKLASIEDNETTETESVDQAPQHHTGSGDNPNTKNTGHASTASDDNSMAQADGDQRKRRAGGEVSSKKHIKQKLRSTPKKTLERITALDAAIEWYTREKFKTLDTSRWGDLQEKIGEHREELAKLLQSIGIDENRPQDEAWGWAIRFNEQIRQKWQDCDQTDPLAKHKTMEEIDELNETRRLKLEAISKEDCPVTLMGWVSPKKRKPLPKEAIPTAEPSPKQQTTDEDASSQSGVQPPASIVNTDVAMTEGPDASTQANGDKVPEQATITTAEYATGVAHNDAMDVDDDLFGGDFGFADECPDLVAPVEANGTSEPINDSVPAPSQTIDGKMQVVESPKASLPFVEAAVAPEPQVIPVDSNAAQIQEGDLSTVPIFTLETNGNQDNCILGSVPTSFNDDFVATQNPQAAEVLGTRVPVLNAAEEALFEELIDVSLLEDNARQDQVSAGQEHTLAPVEDSMNQSAVVPQDIPVIVNQGDAVVDQATEVTNFNGDFKSSAEWNEYSDVPTLEEFLQFIDEPTQQTIRAIAWEKLQKFVQPDEIHRAQLDVFAFSPPEVQEAMLAEYEESHQNGGQLTLPLYQSHWNDPMFSGRTPICVNLTNFVVQMYPLTETPPDEIVNEQVQLVAQPLVPAAQPVVPDTSGSFDLESFDLESFDFGSFDFSGPIELEDIVNHFADVSGDQAGSSTEHVQETVEGSVVPEATGYSSPDQHPLQSPAQVTSNKPAQAKKGAATKKATQRKKSAPAKRKTATRKKKGTELPLQAPVDENTFGQFVQGDVVEDVVTPAQEVGDGLDDWASAWCQRTWSEEDPEPKDLTPAELARLQQLGMSFNQGMYTASLNPSPNTSSNLIGAINGHLSQAAPNGVNTNALVGAPAPVAQEAPATPAKRSHRGRPAAPVNTLRKNRTRKLKHPESPQKVPSGKYTRRKSKSPGSTSSESSVPQQPENAPEQSTVYYEAAPNRRLGLDTSPEDWVAQSKNKRKRAKPAKETTRKAQKTQQPSPVSLQSSPPGSTDALNGKSPYRAILPRPTHAQPPSNGTHVPAPAADTPEHSYGSVNARAPMAFGQSSPVQQAAGPYMGLTMGMPSNAPAQVSQPGFQQMPQGNMIPQQKFQHGMGMGLNGGMQSSTPDMHSTLKQPVQQSMKQPGLQGMQNAGLADMVDSDSDDELHEEIMRRLRKTEKKAMQQKALRRIAEMEAEMREDAMVIAGSK